MEFWSKLAADRAPFHGTAWLRRGLDPALVDPAAPVHSAPQPGRPVRDISTGVEVAVGSADFATWTDSTWEAVSGVMGRLASGTERGSFY